MEGGTGREGRGGRDKEGGSDEDTYQLQLKGQIFDPTWYPFSSA